MARVNAIAHRIALNNGLTYRQSLALVRAHVHVLNMWDRQTMQMEVPETFILSEEQAQEINEIVQFYILMLKED